MPSNILQNVPWPESASELYRLIAHRLSAEVVLTFADIGVPRSQRCGSPKAVMSVFWTRAATFSSK
jgi:hypothetical protein